jgi:hypothetical protein
MSYGSLSHRKYGGCHEIHLFGIYPAGEIREHDENEGHAMLDECLDYDDELRANGHFVAGEGLQPPDTATTLVLEERQSRGDRRSLRRDQGTTSVASHK